MVNCYLNKHTFPIGDTHCYCGESAIRDILWMASFCRKKPIEAIESDINIIHKSKLDGSLTDTEYNVIMQNYESYYEAR